MTENTATDKPAFSFANLSVEDAVVPRITRESSAEPNPFTDVVKATYTLPGDDGKSITVPAQNAPQAIYLLRSAAAASGYGLRLAMQDKNGKRLDMGSKGGKKVEKDGKARMVGATAIVLNEAGNPFGGNVTIVFRAKDKKLTKTELAKVELAKAKAEADAAAAAAAAPATV